MTNDEPIHLGWLSFPQELQDELLAESERHRARKDRRRWCRGKEGVEHVREVRLSKLARYWQTRNPAREGCGWRHGFRSGGLGVGYVPDLESWNYHCTHEEGCSRCGKVLVQSLGQHCPDYAPRQTATS